MPAIEADQIVRPDVGRNDEIRAIGAGERTDDERAIGEIANERVRARGGLCCVTDDSANRCAGGDEPLGDDAAGVAACSKDGEHAPSVVLAGRFIQCVYGHDHYAGIG